MAQLRGRPYSLNYQVDFGNEINGRGNDLGYGNNVKDWIIRIELLSPYMVWIWRAFNDFKIIFKIDYKIIIKIIMGDIYKIKNKINNKLYVGQAIKILSNGKKNGYLKRFQIHIKNSLTNKKNGCPLLENAIRKYGSDNFEIELILECKISELNYYENYYVEYYNTLSPNGYNLMTGGGNGRILSDESRNKMSKTRTGKKHTEITKQRIGEKHKNKIVKKESKKLMSLTKKINNVEKYPDEIKNALKVLNIKILPMYIYYNFDNRPTRQNYIIIVNIPNKKIKKFCSKKNLVSENLQKAINFKDNLINGHRS